MDKANKLINDYWFKNIIDLEQRIRENRDIERVLSCYFNLYIMAKEGENKTDQKSKEEEIYKGLIKSFEILLALDNDSIRLNINNRIGELKKKIEGIATL